MIVLGDVQFHVSIRSLLEHRKVQAIDFRNHLHICSNSVKETVYCILNLHSGLFISISITEFHSSDSNGRSSLNHL